MQRMQVNRSTGRLEGVSYLASPNCNARPAGCEPELVVIHGISVPAGHFGDGHVEGLFTNELDTDSDERLAHLSGVQVSAHLLIHRDGHITQFVPFNQRAWHAGESSFNQRANCNDFSIGIELEGTDMTTYAGVQYDVLEQVLRALREAYPEIGDDRVVGHCHIAPGRKSDPGPRFDWGRLQRSLGILQPVTQPRVSTR
jgi:AmpD protein